MREIKFRAWDKDNNQMRYIDIMWFSEKDLPFFNYNLMQFTGLYDKNGREIYEGDIVTHNGTNSNARRNSHLLITFADGAFCLEALGQVDCDSKTTIRDAMYEAKCYGKELELEVIGNIYENPELLERSETK